MYKKIYIKKAIFKTDNNNGKIIPKFDIYYFVEWFLDTNIYKLPRNIFQIAMFLFDYIGLAYFRNNDATPLALEMCIILYYSSVINELSMENNIDHQYIAQRFDKTP